ncbi:MAG TPA: MgtC/SapB family protein [Phycisphaerales bacterium]|nr:MgtC/SapB family protein [Phycisphaerales bacterium]
METPGLGQIALRIGVALLCGVVIGIEREQKRRPVGFRTMILVCVGTCGFALLAVRAMTGELSGGPVAIEHGSEPPGAGVSRVLQGLLAGIGFLGAAAVLHSGMAVKGVTTAAAVWVVAAVGACCGLGELALASMLTAVAFFTLTVLGRVEDRFFPGEPAAPDGEGAKTRGGR